MSCAADEGCPVQTAIGQSDFGRSSHTSVLQKQDNLLSMADSDGTSPPSKYKSSLLNRYLNDTLRHMMAAEASPPPSARKRRSHSESFSSSEDRDVVSPASSYETEANYVYQMGEILHDLSWMRKSDTFPKILKQVWEDPPGSSEIHNTLLTFSLKLGSAERLS